MRRLVFLCALLMLAAVALVSCGTADTVRKTGDACAPARSLVQGTTAHTLNENGETRTYLMHVPPQYDGSSKAPVVLLFHGLGGNPSTMMQTTRMLDLADDEGFILVAPAGRGKVSKWDFRSGVDVPGSDLGFVRDLVASVSNVSCVDSSRVYAAGFSNGSALTLALACDGTTKFAGYGAVSAPFHDGTCAKAPPAPIIYFHGMKDKVVPYGGAKTVIGRLPPVNDTMNKWVTHDRCAARGARTTVKEHVRHFSWSSCRAGSAVEVYAVDNGGHRWPGGTRVSPGRGGGIQTQDIDASTLIWRFFELHRRGGQ